MQATENVLESSFTNEVQKMDKTMQAFHNTYNQLFFDASVEFVPASDFDSYALMGNAL